MSKSKNKKAKAGQQPQTTATQKSSGSGGSGTNRRRFLTLGLGGAGTLAIAGLAGYKAGWFASGSVASTSNTHGKSTPIPAPSIAAGKSLPPVVLTPTRENALRAGEEIVSHYTRSIQNGSTMIHAVRAFGKNFKMDDGAKAVDLLCSRYAEEQEVNGKKYVYFPRKHESHDNSFLKTFLEAGVAQDKQIIAGGNKYVLHDLGQNAKSLFRCDPQNLQKFDPKLVQSHLPWGLIAFSILVPPSQPTWVNAYGETINLPEVIDRSLAVFEGTCLGVSESIARGEGESIEFRQAMAQYSCSALHNIYAYFSCYKHGFRGNDMPRRMQNVFDTLVLRLKGDVDAIDSEAEVARTMGQQYINRMGTGPDGRNTAKGAAPAQTVEVMRLRYIIIAIGHALEAINYVRLHKLFTPTPEQMKRIQDGEKALYDALVKLRATDLDAFLNWYWVFVDETVIAVAHAVRAMKLLTAENPDIVVS